LIPEVGPAELERWRHDADAAPPVLVDVREPWEFAYCHISDSRSVPLAELPVALGTLPRDRDLVVVCHTGMRSYHAAAWLRNAGFQRVFNLRGGVAAWAAEVEPAMKQY
jgi:rhodanese-related sulfurtransferase